MTRFSIITICYNDAAGLRGTLASVESQEFTDHEHVIVDGGSSDGSVDLVREYAERSQQRVDWTSEPDGGIYDAMNRGIRRATGDIIVFVNSGDGLHDPSTLARVDALFREHQPRWLFGQSQFVDEAGRPLWVTSQLSYTTARAAAGLGYAPHQASYFTRALVEEIGEYDLSLSYAADQEFVLRAGMHGQPLVVPDVLAYFLAGGTHSTATGWKREHLYQEMRRKNGLLLLDSPVVDSFYTKGMAAYRDGRRTLAKQYRALKGSRPQAAAAEARDQAGGVSA